MPDFTLNRNIYCKKVQEGRKFPYLLEKLPPLLFRIQEVFNPRAVQHSKSWGVCVCARTHARMRVHMLCACPQGGWREVGGWGVVSFRKLVESI